MKEARRCATCSAVRSKPRRNGQSRHAVPSGFTIVGAEREEFRGSGDLARHERRAR
jgi:hypothetical protein